jgi:hypothetical protein
VVEAGFGTMALIVHADLPAKNVAELIALAPERSLVGTRPSERR